MTGPEHYAEAERLVRNAQDALDEAVARNDGQRVSVALEVAGQAAVVAQVHATLAQAAATLDVQLNEHLLAAWAEVLS